jgi:phospholipid/cholesterol/gamma-HCH transport system substrate-binding protein
MPSLRPNSIVRAVAFATLLAVVILAAVLLQGGSVHRLRLLMSDASGLRPGSQVLVGGVPVGTVGSLSLGAHDLVVADLTLNRRDVRVGHGASASIVAANLLGEEYVALLPGDQQRPLASGATIPPSRVTLPTDLDQIVNVLDSQTRTALATFINEAGIAVAGRRNDVTAVLRQLPLSVEAATRLLTQLVHDNHTLDDVIGTTNQFLGRVTNQRVALGDALGAASGAADTAARRAGDLRQTLRSAPAALTTLQAFLGGLSHTARALTPASEELTASSRPLSDVLSKIAPFARAAIPTLDRAAAVAPQLGTLGTTATPIIQRSLPTLHSLGNLALSAKPLTYWANASVVDLIALLQGWDRAIQFRDGLGHIFHTSVALDPSLIVNLAKHGSPATGNLATRQPQAPPPRGAGVPATTTPHHTMQGSVPAGARATPQSSSPPAATVQTPPPTKNPLASLLDYLLGR